MSEVNCSIGGAYWQQEQKKTYKRFGSQLEISLSLALLVSIETASKILLTGYIRFQPTKAKKKKIQYKTPPLYPFFLISSLFCLIKEKGISCFWPLGTQAQYNAWNWKMEMATQRGIKFVTLKMGRSAQDHGSIPSSESSESIWTIINHSH